MGTGISMHPAAFYTEVTEKDYVRISTGSGLVEVVIDNQAFLFTPKAADSFGSRLQTAAQEALSQ